MHMASICDTISLHLPFSRIRNKLLCGPSLLSSAVLPQPQIVYTQTPKRDYTVSIVRLDPTRKYQAAYPSRSTYR
ncbi:hypothetical protein EWB00_010872 [Schistosoma japonicum]|uniref:Uncharacterized protein n=1 Tax=Schistosoma japonicum TaxID=6182 RepID=A0A4Z2DM96_SCHJA|nr:hypothetical protein EWB00_010872 [Schistosoma japonicum]